MEFTIASTIQEPAVLLFNAPTWGPVLDSQYPIIMVTWPFWSISGQYNDTWAWSQIDGLPRAGDDLRHHLDYPLDKSLVSWQSAHSKDYQWQRSFLISAAATLVVTASLGIANAPVALVMALASLPVGVLLMLSRRLYDKKAVEYRACLLFSGAFQAPKTWGRKSPWFTYRSEYSIQGTFLGLAYCCGSIIAWLLLDHYSTRV